MTCLEKLDPSALIALAISIEKENGKIYSEWAEKFDLFDSDISQLMSKLGDDKINHQARLQEYLSSQVFNNLE